MLSKVRLERMHDVLARHVDDGSLPGLVHLLAHGDQVHVEAIGTTTVGGDVPMRRDTIFRLASVSKCITAAAAMTLVEDGTIRLDDPVDDLLPELANPRVLRTITSPIDDTVTANRPITVRDLLTFRHGSGLFFEDPATHPILAATADAGFAPGPPRPSAEKPVDEWMAAYGSLPLLFQPGERWLYHHGAELLGVLLARAAGTSLGDVLRTRIFEPLGMVDTGFVVPEGDRATRFAACYLPDLSLYDDPITGDWTVEPAFPSGGGGLVSTVDDLHRFGSMLLHGGDGVLSPASIALMTTDQLTDAQKATSGFGPDMFAALGWGFGGSVVTKRTKLAAVGTYGWDGGFGTSFYVDRATDLVRVVLTNVLWPGPQGNAVAWDAETLAYASVEQ
jgi:CubicO group peptidase (beta-lactamase class C family)